VEEAFMVVALALKAERVRPTLTAIVVAELFVYRVSVSDNVVGMGAALDNSKVDAI
jgi:hypothetical protein